MRISSFHIDGFGALSDIGYDDLAPGLVVALGPNEAGKSTLFDFLAGVLFGFPARRLDARFRPPSRGGRHGGRVGFVDDAEGRWAIERYAGPGKTLKVRTPNGELGDATTLRRALAGASAGLFRAVFAVGLDELGGLESLSDDEVRELLFTASLLGQRSSASIAMRDLGDQCSLLARPRRNDARANRLAGEMETVRTELVAARRQAASYGSLRREVADLKTGADLAHSALRQARSRDRELHLLLRAWPIHSRHESLAHALDSLGGGELDEALLGQGDGIRALAAAKSGHDERLARLGGLTQESGRQKGAVSSGLARLGEGWTDERARASVDPGVLADHVRTCRQEMTLLATEVASCEALLVDAEEALAAASEEAQALASRLPGGDRPPQRSLIEQELDLVDELHDRYCELERLDSELAAGERGSAASSPGAAGRNSSLSTAAHLLVVAVAVAGLCGLALAVRSVPVALAAGALALGLAAAGLLLGRQGGPGTQGWLGPQAREAPQGRRAPQAGPAEATALAEQSGDMSSSKAALAERERSRMHELAGGLGLPIPLSRVDIERCAARLQRRLDERRHLDNSAAAVALAARKAETAQAAHSRRLRDLESKRQDFARWRSRHGLGAFGEPDEALDAIAVLVDVRARLQEVARLEGVRETTEEEVAAFFTEVTRLSAATGSAALPSCSGKEVGQVSLPTSVELAERQVARLIEALVGAEDREQRRRQLQADLAGTQDALRDLVGNGSGGEVLSFELASGRVAEWEEESGSLAEVVEQLEAAEELAVRRHQSLSEAIEDLARSDHIAVLEQREASLEAELDSTLRQYLVLGTARTLLQRTLTHHEKEHQPAVIASAAAHFERVTGGRYVNLVADAAAGGQTIRVVSAGGAEIDATCLSRGTIEQLYLCLRLGLADSFAERAVGLPMVLDDVLVNFDPERAESMAAELAVTARRRQVLLMTCHPALAELALRSASQSAAESQLIELERIA